MSTLNWSLKQINGDNAFFTTNAATVYKQGQFILNTQTQSIYVGDGVTALSGLTAWGGGSGLDVGTSAITNGTNGYILYNNNGTLGNLATTGTGSVVLATSPTFVTDITTPKINGVSGSLLFENSVQSSGTVIDFRFNKAAHTGQTASSPVNGFLFVTGSREWQAGAITEQGEFEITTPTYSFTSPSTITTAATLIVNRPNPGANATLTNRYAILTKGAVKVGLVASSGVTTPVGGTTLAVDSNTTNYISLNQPDASTGGIIWGSPSDVFAAAITYGYTANILNIQTARTGGYIKFFTADQTERGQIDTNGNWVIGTGALATTATNGFLYNQTCAGAPTGTPTTHTGRVATVVDTTNLRVYYYIAGTWRYAQLT